ncbi:hypothetical protein AAC387_Pa09g0635 [Persea americana]
MAISLQLEPTEPKPGCGRLLLRPPSSVVRGVIHRSNAWVRRSFLVTTSSLRTTRLRTMIFSFFLFPPLLRTKFENQKSPSSLSFSGKQQQ